MKRLKIGDTAPQFISKDLKDKEIVFDKSENWTFITFQRFAACPFCNMRTNELINSYDELQKNNVDIISFWPSSKENMDKFVGSRPSPFPLVLDPSKEIYEKYGVTVSSKSSMLKLMMHPKLLLQGMKNKYKNEVVDADMFLLPAGFLINPEGKIVIAHYGTHIADHLAIDKILAQVSK